MSALARYPVPQAVASGAVDPSRLYFRLEATVVPAPVLDFLRPLQAKEAIEAGAVANPRLYFRLEPIPALGFLRPLRALAPVSIRAVGVPTLYFRLDVAVVAVTAGTRRQRQIKSLARTKTKRGKARRRRC